MTTASKRYQLLAIGREGYIERGKEVSRLTIPYVFTGDEQVGQTSSEMPDPHQSVGSRGVRNLTARMVTTLVPPHAPFFVYSIDDEIKEDLPEGVDEGAVNLALGHLTKSVHNAIVRSNLRVEAVETFMALIVDGNPLLHIDDDFNFTVFRLNQFVVQRDQSDNLLEIVLKETVTVESLRDDDEAMRAIEAGGKDTANANVDIYTRIKRNGDRFEEYQEIADTVIESSRSDYSREHMPWILPRMSKVTGESYGRSYGEEFLGDLRSLEGLSKSTLDMAAASSRVLFMVNPTSGFNVRNLAKTPNGGFITGDANQIQALQANLAGDFQVVQAEAGKIEQRIAQAFLLMSSVQRSAERVTAEEIRLMASELDNALGGLFTILASEFQLPIVRVFESKLRRKGTLSIPSAVKPRLITGVDALGRGQDLGRLNQFIANLMQLGNALPGVAKRINESELVDRLAAAHGIDPNGLIKSDELMQGEAEQEAQAQQANGPMGQAMGQAMVANADPLKQAQAAKLNAETAAVSE
jgi:hypothetical protein